ncbi:DUF4296 domain-containing protein [Aquiflexum sp. XJ19-11]|uniref:DUF4296 domain-containing protein n=2 Tax=Aquiflexum gelatinilyticum TaxID=2961943 RepID=A0A9X2P700_9BACT|nr:DUF4296 domain-containing protein [Aquiflexum gelatinilyticum]
MKNKIVIMLMLFAGFACNKQKIPEGILSEDKMVEVLIDIHLAEGLVSSFPIHYDSSRVLYPYFENEVFLKHDVTDSVFKKSLEYYMLDIKTMDRIYARTIDSLHVVEKARNPNPNP